MVFLFLVKVNMGGKKGLIIIISLILLGIVGYFIFSGNKESDRGSKTFSGFAGRLFGSSDKDRIINRGSENFRKQTESLNGNGGNSRNSINQANQVTQDNVMNGGNSS